ncbi:unnamed protein product [Linum trigynum]|uniref:RNase H type-1 domain-containing protein n=1 Tax=Linum trigynum TaxID=586398 RepID=A0AAV2GT71_9ROSI
MHSFGPMLSEFNCQNLIRKLYREEESLLEIGFVASEIRNLEAKIENVKWRFWGRAANEAMHLMARMQCPWEDIYLADSTFDFLFPQLYVVVLKLGMING